MKLLGLAFVIFALTVILAVSQLTSTNREPDEPGPQAVAERFASVLASDGWQSANDYTIWSKDLVPREETLPEGLYAALHRTLAGGRPTGTEAELDCLWRDASDVLHSGACITQHIDVGGEDIRLKTNVELTPAGWRVGEWSVSTPTETLIPAPASAGPQPEEASGTASDPGRAAEAASDPGRTADSANDPPATGASGTGR